MDPAVPVSELDRRNVTLFCDVRDGNPAALVSVRWYFDGELLKQVRPYFMNEVASHLHHAEICSGNGPFERVGQ